MLPNTPVFRNSKFEGRYSVEGNPPRLQCRYQRHLHLFLHHHSHQQQQHCVVTTIIVMLPVTSLSSLVVIVVIVTIFTLFNFLGPGVLYPKMFLWYTPTIVLRSDFVRFGCQCRFLSPSYLLIKSRQLSVPLSKQPLRVLLEPELVSFSASILQPNRIHHSFISAYYFFTKSPCEALRISGDEFLLHTWVISHLQNVGRSRPIRVPPDLFFDVVAPGPHPSGM
mmetsp:Transcript_23722/g.33164  ORF Transcript_23722/g.33164 Transcript_23722/m.33164 type:complete len:223 (+) Transcript_23722:2308-2976(+)